MKTILIAACLLLVPLRLLSQGFFFVFGPPEAMNAQEGNSSLAPFATTESARLQQVFSASLFSNRLPPQGGYITGLSFRTDQFGFPFTSTIGSCQVSFSTTTRGPDSLSPVYADNIGADEQIVFGPASQMIQGGPGSGFSTGIPMNQPFYYNPANGNLLMDIRVFTGAGNHPAGGIFDAFNVAGDSVGSVFAFGSTLPQTGNASSLGLAMLLTVTPVPEPGTRALLMAGVLCLAIGHRKRKKQV